MDGPTKTALIVDDDPDIRLLMRDWLERLGFEVREAGSGKAAIEALEFGEPPSMVCLDLMLPETSGFVICERIRSTARLCQLPVLVISARSMPPDRALAEELGASAYLVKPFEWPAFAGVIESLFEAEPPFSG